MRDAYVNNSLHGFRTSKVTSLCVPSDGTGVFVGTTEGAVARYESQYSSPSEEGIRSIFIQLV